jgi:membrane protease YdiL (CAAX protease family)
MIKTAVQYLLTALGISVILSGLGLLLDLDKSLLAFLYSAGPLITAFYFGSLKNIFALKKVRWLVLAAIAPLIYIALPSYFIQGSLDFRYLPALLTLVLSLIGVIFEELFWRGFLFEKFKKLSFFKMNLIIGLMWAIWHYPAIFVGSYQLNHSLFISVPIFTLNVVLLSFIFGSFRKLNGAVVAPIIIHFAHNWVYKIFEPPTFMAEDGLGLTIVLFVFTIFTLLLRLKTATYNQ